MYQHKRRHQENNEIAHQKYEALDFIGQIDQNIHIFPNIQLAIGKLPIQLITNPPIPLG
jgi:hypothetical protein